MYKLEFFGKCTHFYTIENHCDTNSVNVQTRKRAFFFCVRWLGNCLLGGVWKVIIYYSYYILSLVIYLFVCACGEFVCMFARLQCLHFDLRLSTTQNDLFATLTFVGRKGISEGKGKPQEPFGPTPLLFPLLSPLNRGTEGDFKKSVQFHGKRCFSSELCNR